LFGLSRVEQSDFATPAFITEPFRWNFFDSTHPYKNQILLQTKDVSLPNKRSTTTSFGASCLERVARKQKEAYWSFWDYPPLSPTYPPRRQVLSPHFCAQFRKGKRRVHSSTLTELSFFSKIYCVKEHFLALKLKPGPFLLAVFLREYTPNDNLVRQRTENPRICRFKASIILRLWKAHISGAVVSA